MSRFQILTQDKDYEGKISKPAMKKIVLDFKEQYKDSLGIKPLIGGFEINGGVGLTKPAQEVFDQFQKWCGEKGLFCIYNNNEELEKIRINLSNRVHNINHNNIHEKNW